MTNNPTHNLENGGVQWQVEFAPSGVCTVKSTSERLVYFCNFDQEGNAQLFGEEENGKMVSHNWFEDGNQIMRTANGVIHKYPMSKDDFRQLTEVQSYSSIREQALKLNK